MNSVGGSTSMARRLWRRRDFIRSGAQAVGALSVSGAVAVHKRPSGEGYEPGACFGTESHNSDAAAPWYRRALRWGQTNITELDPTRYDIVWWREYWSRTGIQGVIINAGGI